MKKIITSILFLLIFTSAFSQMKRIDSMLINVDKTNFTNILYERTTPWSKLNIFNDSINISTKGHFEQALHVFLMNRIKMLPFKTQNVTRYSAAL
jgi:hypothetical protein